MAAMPGLSFVPLLNLTVTIGTGSNAVVLHPSKVSYGERRACPRERDFWDDLLYQDPILGSTEARGPRADIELRAVPLRPRVLTSCAATRRCPRRPGGRESRGPSWRRRRRARTRGA